MKIILVIIVVVLAAVGAIAWASCSRNGDKPASAEKTGAALDRAAERASEVVSRAESIRRVRVLAVDFTEANGYLTPSLKVKRSLVLKDFADQVDAIYS